MNNSLWIESTNKSNYPKLENNISTDVCIIGGGITGASTAYMLMNSNLNITIIDKDKICMGVSANSTGKLTSQHGLFYDYLINSYGYSFAKKYLDSNEKAIKDVYDIICKENIDCDFEFQNSFVFTELESELEKIKNEINAVNSLGFDSTFVKDIPLPINILRFYNV